MQTKPKYKSVNNYTDIQREKIFEKDIEIILVYDGSTYRSQILCDEYSAKDNRIRVLHKKNGGLSSARNSGVQIAKSDYILFVDGDNCILRNTIQRLVEIVTQYYTQLF